MFEGLVQNKTILEELKFRTLEERGFDPEDVPILGAGTFAHMEFRGRRWTVVADDDNVVLAAEGDWDMSRHGFTFQKNKAVIA